MMEVNVADDIQPLTAFKRDTLKFAKRLKRSRKPMVLTVEGKARFVVFDAEAFQDWKEQVETVLEVEEALNEKGESRPAAEVFAEIRKRRFGIPNRASSSR